MNKLPGAFVKPVTRLDKMGYYDLAKRDSMTARHSGQNTGETAKFLADRFGRTNQQRETLTSTQSDLQIAQSHQLEPVIPESRIATLSPGEFVGMVADTAEQPIDLKSFCSRTDIDFPALKAEEASFHPLPIVKKVTPEILNATFLRVRTDIATLVETEMQRISTTLELEHLILK